MPFVFQEASEAQHLLPATFSEIAETLLPIGAAARGLGALPSWTAERWSINTFLLRKDWPETHTSPLPATERGEMPEESFKSQRWNKRSENLSQRDPLPRLVSNRRITVYIRTVIHGWDCNPTDLLIEKRIIHKTQHILRAPKQQKGHISLCTSLHWLCILPFWESYHNLLRFLEISLALTQKPYRLQVK